MNEYDEGSADRKKWELPDELKIFEKRLSALRPRSDRLDRERLIFLAGQASVAIPTEPQCILPGVRWGGRGWSAAFAAMTVVAATLFAMLITRPAVNDTNITSDNGIKVVDAGGSRRQPPETQGARPDRRGLSTTDAYRTDFDRFLSAKSALSHARRPTMETPFVDREQTPLTPAGWRHLTDGNGSLGPPEGDSTQLTTQRGVNS